MYTGPNPKDINSDYPNHTHELIVCLIDGSQRKIIQERTLKNNYGITKKEYLEKFPNAPLMSLSAKESRSNNMRNLNLNNKEFQEKRTKASREFLDSDRSIEYRKDQSIKAIKQHKETNLEDSIRDYFKSDFIGSTDQMARSIRARENNPGSSLESRKKIRSTYIKNSDLGLHNKETKYKKRIYKDTTLMYQSSYELDFLEYCELNNLIGRIKNSPCFSSDTYPYNFYAPDYILDNEYIIEIKSRYIENLQEKRCPGLLEKKKNLIISKGYKFVYIRDKDYSVIIDLLK